MMNDDNNAAATTTHSPGTFLHREIFHLKPRKVDIFRARLIKEYTSSSLSTSTTTPSQLTQNQQQDGPNNSTSSSTNNRPRPRNHINVNAGLGARARAEIGIAHRRRGSGGGNNGSGRNNNNNAASTTSIIQHVRQMNGCYSFDIYCRAENPFKETEWVALHQDTTSSTGSAESANEEEVSDLEKKPSPEQKQEEEAQVESPSSELKGAKPVAKISSPCSRNVPDDFEKSKDRGPPKNEELATPGEQALRSDSNDDKEDKTKNDDDEGEEKEDKLPHQFMVLGRWEESNAHQIFFVDRTVQKFFCPLISRKVIESLPILTMWNKQNGIHHRMDIDNITTNGNDNTTHESSSSPTDIFIMTRKRTLTDPSVMNQALSLIKEIASFALKEDGCLVYDICTTGHPDFNENEIMEVSVWTNEMHFVNFFARQSLWIERHVSLCRFFDSTSEETSFWERPKASTSSSPPVKPNSDDEATVKAGN